MLQSYEENLPFDDRSLILIFWSPPFRSLYLDRERVQKQKKEPAAVPMLPLILDAFPLLEKTGRRKSPGRMEPSQPDTK